MITAIMTGKTNMISTIAQKIGDLSENHVKILAEAHKKELDKAIDDTRERTNKTSGYRLKEQIEVEEIKENGSVGYGVGNINTLNQKAPWWAWINFGKAQSGRTIPPGTKENPRITGHFVPGTKGIFTKGQPKFPMNPTKAIKAHNYIEKALGVMVSKVRNLINNEGTSI